MKPISLAVLAFVASASFAQAATVNGFTSFVALGDSLSDDGKLGALQPPSDGGRFSNGPTFAEVIGDEFLASFNLAIGGATAGDNAMPIAPISTFTGQVGFLNSLLGGISSALGNNPLVSVLFGANDLFQNLGTVPGIGMQAAMDVEDGIRNVAALDPRFDDFLLISLPNLGLTPAFAIEPEPVRMLATEESNDFNEQLSISAEVLRGEGLNIIEFDLDTFFQSALVDLGLAFGPCTADITVAGPNCVDAGIDPDTLFFVDGVHPNRIVHAAAADAILTALPEVPLPAGLPLLLTGIALYGLASRRNRSRV
ncbi:MAG: SGNH/GDSL hydrolase family protein [Pseudomonadota bacterium]